MRKSFQENIWSLYILGKLSLAAVLLTITQIFIISIFAISGCKEILFVWYKDVLIMIVKINKIILIFILHNVAITKIVNSFESS